MADKTFESFSEFHAAVPELARRMTADTQLAARALANPILALQELGVTFTPALEREVERWVRFTKADRERLATLEQQLHVAVGEAFDPESEHDVERVLFTKLKLARPKQPERSEQARDPLHDLSGKHPAVALLLAFRAISQRVPKLAPREAYERLKTSKQGLPVSKIVLRLPAHQGGRHA
jgi:hypothetical protein